MPTYQVTTATVFQFEAQNAEQAKWLVQNGEMPSNHTMEDAYIIAVENVTSE